MQKIKYITNKDLLGEIKICKASFCSFIQPEFSTYDAIVANTDLITEELVAKTLVAKAARLSSKTQTVESESLDPNAVVFRVMTDDHLPPIDDKKRRRSTSGSLMKTNFSPFRHYILDDGVLIEVGRSHWQGGFDSGKFNVEHGRINNRLASMFMLLVERYSRGGNWRGYCTDDKTEALTQRGWLNMYEINEDDIILSYEMETGHFKWSKIKSIFRDHFEGKMFKLDAAGIDAFVTPHHKFVTQRGLVEVEELKKSDTIILSGTTLDKTIIEALSDNVEFNTQVSMKNVDIRRAAYQGMVWCPQTEYGTFIARRNGTIYASSNTYVDEMRSHAIVQLSQVGLQFDESRSDNPFAFYTQIIKNSFRRVLNLERKSQSVRDDLLIMAGAMPSYTRQVDNEMEQRAEYPDKPAKRGRKPKEVVST